MSALGGVLTAGEAYRSNDELVAACLSGDERAWGELVDRYKNLIFSIPLRQGLGRDEAADVFQAVCLELVAELPRLRDPQALPAWLIRITARKVMKLRKRIERNVPDEGDLDRATSHLDDLPDTVIEHLERTQALRDGIEGLAERCRTMVRMLFFDTPAKSYREVAEALGVATGSIGFLRGRCLERLRSALEKAGL